MVSASELIRLRYGHARSTAARPTSSPAGSPFLWLRHPDDVNVSIQMQRSVTALNESFRPTNTNKAHDPKIEEFFQFCDSLYGHEATPYHLHSEKVFCFMYYQCFRSLKKRGGPRHKGKKNNPKKKRQTNNGDAASDEDEDDDEDDDEETKEPVKRFDREAYDAVIANFTGTPGREVVIPEISAKPIGWSTFDHYK
jgi:hypothetical protein